MAYSQSIASTYIYIVRFRLSLSWVLILIYLASKGLKSHSFFKLMTHTVHTRKRYKTGMKEKNERAS